MRTWESSDEVWYAVNVEFVYHIFHITSAKYENTEEKEKEKERKKKTPSARRVRPLPSAKSIGWAHFVPEAG